MGSVFGGSKTTVPASGFFAMPGAYQDAFNKILGNVNNSIGSINEGMFRPMDMTPDEQRALEMYRGGFTPTADSLKSDISMLMNPFDEFVTQDVNRAASSDYSILKQALNQAGQFGSNRQILGANDIEQTRLGTIGKLRQGAYNDAIDNIFSRIIPQRQQDAAGLLGIGDFQRELDSRQKTAPLQALSAQTGLIGSIPTDFGNFGSPATTIKSGGGLGGFLGGLTSLSSLIPGPTSLMNMGAPAWMVNGASFLSDRRLKENVKPAGERNGFPIYEFNYINDPQVYVGVMADEVEKIMPEAIGEFGGYKTVDYGKLGFELEKKHGAPRLN